MPASATTKEKKKWDSQYMNDFRPRRYPRQVPKRPTSASRHNNPHPQKDFLMYDLQPRTQEDEVHVILRSAIAKSELVGPGGPRDLNSIPIGPVPRTEPVLDVGPHWSQWPQLPQSARSVRKVNVELSPRLPYSAREPGRTSVPENECSNMAATMAYGDRNVIMHRGLSPRRAAPPVMPGRTLTHYGSFGNRQGNNPYMVGALDLQASPYNANRGFNQGITSYSSRQSRPMHRHMRTASKGEEYLHNHSIFYSTTPNVTGYFIIHPDWVSERLSLKRSQSLLSF